MQRIAAVLIVLIFIMSVMFWVSLSISHAAHDDSACATCHSDDVDEAQARLYVHAPFRDGKCGACHVSDSAGDEVTSEDDIAQSAAPQSDPAENPEGIAGVDVRWLYEYFEPLQELLLPLSDAEVQKMLVVELWDQCRDEHQHVVPLPPLQQATPLPPQSKGEVKIHSFNITRDPRRPDTVIVQCRTNVPVRGEVHLHDDGGQVRIQRAPEGFHTRMEIRLQGLRSNSRYELELACTGVDGKAQSSPMHVFVPAQLEAQAQNGSAAGDDNCALEADIGIYQGECDSGRCYFLSIAANQPVTLSVGVLKAGVEVPAHLEDAHRSASGTGLDDDTRKEGDTGFHSELAGPYFTNYESCRPCHGDFFGPMSHPVDIVPGVGMEVSPELPRLEDGRITCMTCHVFHGGNDHYRLRFGSKKKLCHACHDEY